MFNWSHAQPLIQHFPALCPDTGKGPRGLKGRKSSPPQGRLPSPPSQAPSEQVYAGVGGAGSWLWGWRTLFWGQGPVDREKGAISPPGGDKDLEEKGSGKEEVGPALGGAEV